MPALDATAVASSLQRVRDRITAAGGDARVSVLAVTKGFGAEAIEAALAAGCTAIGENYAQELLAKREAAARAEVHFIGQLQTNKAAAVARYADVVHSVDRARLADALQRGAHAAGRRLGVLVQVALDHEEARAGVDPADARLLADQVAQAPELDLLGVMAVAPLGGDPGEAFARLRDVSRGIQAAHPAARWVSAGMSADLEAAIAHGATHLRVGSAILGSRPPLR
jgi:PLP dependent protein